MLRSTNFLMLTICCKCRFPIQISSEIFIHWVKRLLQWCAPLWSTSILCETILLILLSHKNYLMNLREIFRRHRYDPLPHLQVQCYHGYQSMLYLWQHIGNTLSNLLTYKQHWLISMVMLSFLVWQNSISMSPENFMKIHQIFFVWQWNK